MMLGSRFSVGHEPPRAVPAEMVTRIRALEETLTEQERQSKRWTLTWLEGKPVVTLDDGPTIR